MKFRAIAAVAAMCLFNAGCATVFDGTSQEITVNTNPSGADCVFYREGVQIGTVA